MRATLAAHSLRTRTETWAESNHSALSGVLGALSALAAYSGQAWLCDIVLLGLVLSIGRSPRLWVWAIAIPVALTAPYASIQYMPLWTGARILALGSVWRGLRPEPRAMGIGAACALIPQAIILLVVAPAWYHRVDGFTDNPTVLAEQGLALLTATPLLSGWWLALATAESVAMLASSASRAALGAGVVFAAAWLAHTHLLKRVAILGAIPAIVLLATLSARGGRFSPSGIEGTFESRLDNLVGGEQSRANLLYTSTMSKGEVEARQAGGRIFEPATGYTIDGAPVPDYHAPRLRWGGYGYYSYVRKVGAQGPHNVPAQIAYDLGLLAIPVFAAAAWVIYSGVVRWQLVAGLAVLWALSDVGWTTAGGMYSTAFMASTAGAVFRGKR